MKNQHAQYSIPTVFMLPVILLLTLLGLGTASADIRGARNAALRDAAGTTALMRAHQSGHREIEALLKQASAEE